MPSRDDSSQPRPVAVRFGASLFAGGALITLASVALPHPPAMEVRAYCALAASQLAVALVLLLLMGRGRRAAWLPGLVGGCGVLSVSAAVYFNGERLGGPAMLNELFYVWPAMYSGYFFGRRALCLALGLTATAHVFVLHAIGTEPSLLVTRWTITISVVCGVAIAANALRRHVDRLVHRLREAVRTDALTGVLNRRGFEESFGIELRRVGRTRSPLAVMLGDVDRFKTINDRFGHAAGDAALSAIARTLRTECRPVDVVARIGGEEFAVLMPATTLAEACAAADRLRRALSRETDPAGAPLSMSFGVTVCQTAADADADALLRAADAALYAAKDGGRDRTVAAAV